MASKIRLMPACSRYTDLLLHHRNIKNTLYKKRLKLCTFCKWLFLLNLQPYLCWIRNEKLDTIWPVHVKCLTWWSMPDCVTGRLSFRETVPFALVQTILLALFLKKSHLSTVLNTRCYHQTLDDGRGNFQRTNVLSSPIIPAGANTIFKVMKSVAIPYRDCSLL